MSRLRFTQHGRYPQEKDQEKQRGRRYEEKKKKKNQFTARDARPCVIQSDAFQGGTKKKLHAFPLPYASPMMNE